LNICLKALLLAAATGLLAGCGDEPAPEQGTTDGRSAAGEILEGSISDEMLPYGSLRSRPPLAEISDIPESEGGPPAARATEPVPAGEASRVDDDDVQQEADEDTQPEETAPAAED
jgi:hypothetical protein